MKKKLYMLLSTVVVSGLLVIGCGAKKEETEGSKSQEPQTLTITDAKGEVEIPANPERIVDISGASDILSILGYQVIGTANSDAYEYTKFPTYLEEVLDGVEILGYSMQDMMDIEGILALEPDLIIISTVQEKMYDQLSEVAPTVMLEMAQMDWKEDVEKVAEVLDKSDQAAKWLEDYKVKAKERGTEIREQYGDDATYLAILASGGQIFIFDGAGVGSIFYEDMGLAKPDHMPEQENISLPVVTYEGMAEIDPDYIFVVGTDDDLSALEENSLWQGMNAVKEGNYITLPASPYFNQGYSCLGRELFLDEMPDYMEQMNEEKGN